ncbi:transposase [Pseudoalteromonas sp. B160]
MNKLTLRGQTKVNAQWQLYCLVHNLEKLRNTMH